MSGNNITDESVMILLAQAGDAQAFRAIVDLYDQRLFYFVQRMVCDHEDALDVMQLVWLRVHRSIGRLSSTNAFRVWVYQIAHRQSLSLLRRRGRTGVNLDDVASVAHAGLCEAESLSEFENVELVHMALQDLSVDHRRVLTLRFLEEMSVQQIAEVIDCPPGTVGSRLHYAKQALRRRIQELLNE